MVRRIIKGRGDFCWIYSIAKETSCLLLPERCPAASGRSSYFLRPNLETVFGLRFLASEYSTGEKHPGRIDGLGLDENDTPVIIEYKLARSPSVIGQALYYLDWLMDHRGDFELLVHKCLGKDVRVCTWP